MRSRSLIKDKTPNNEIYSLHSLFSFQSDTTFHFAVSKAPVRKKDHEILCDIFTADSSSTEPNLMFLETKPVSLPMIKKYHGLFNRIFGHEYENEDVLPISEEMFEEVFCSDEENIESGILRDNHIADDEMIDNSDNLGDTIFSRVSHRTN